MKDNELFEILLEMFEKRIQMSRRNFSKATALFSSGLLLNSAASFVLSGCDSKPGWKSASFPKVLLHNFQLFSGLQNGLEKDRIILIEEDTIRGIERKASFDAFRKRGKYGKRNCSEPATRVCASGGCLEQYHP